jgi:hydrogenase expression/formation protein HypC
MCLALPAEVLEVHSDQTATINLGGVHRKVSIHMTPDVVSGEYVIIHAGFAIGTLDQDEALETLALFASLASVEELP